MLARQEDHAHAVLARRRQRDALGRQFLAIERIRQLNQDAGAVTTQRVGPHRAAVIEVVQDQQRLLHQRMAALALDVRHEPDPAGIVLIRRRIQTQRRRLLNHPLLMRIHNPSNRTTS